MNIERLKTLYRYEPETGHFYALKNSGKKRAGDAVGWHGARGYFCITVDGKKYSAHRLAWFYVYGEWPKQQIDHINRNKLDNRISNLRDVSQAINARNRERLSGAHFVKKCGKWKTQIGYEGSVIYLGQFTEKLHAEIAYLAACSVIEAIDARAA